MAVKKVSEPYPFSRLYPEHILDLVRVFGTIGRGVMVASDGVAAQDTERALIFDMPRERFMIATADNGIRLEMSLSKLSYTYDPTDRDHGRVEHRVYDYLEETFYTQKKEEKARLFVRYLVWYGLELFILGTYFWSQAGLSFALGVAGCALASFLSRTIAYVGFSFFWGWFALQTAERFGHHLFPELHAAYLAVFAVVFLVSLWLHGRLEEWVNDFYDT